MAIFERCECGDPVSPDEPWFPKCWNCWRHARAAGARRVDTTVEFLRDVINLTHPDRHPSERAALANRVTAALIVWMKGASA